MKNLQYDITYEKTRIASRRTITAHPLKIFTNVSRQAKQKQKKSAFPFFLFYVERGHVNIRMSSTYLHVRGKNIAQNLNINVTYSFVLLILSFLERIKLVQ